MFFEETLPVLPIQKALGILGKFVNPKSTLLIFRCVHVKGEGTYATLTVCDFSVLVGNVAAQIRVMPEKPYTGEFCADLADFKASCGLRDWSYWETNGPLAEDFPVINFPKEGVELPGSWLADSQKCAKYASSDMTRPALNGVCLSSEGAVATDGHRMLWVDGKYEGDYIVPGFLLAKIKSIKDSPVSTVVENDTAAIRWPWGTIGFRMIEGPFPNWRQILVKQVSWTMSIPRDKILGLTVGKEDKIIVRGKDILIKRLGATVEDKVPGIEVIGAPEHAMAWNARYFQEMAGESDGKVLKVSGNTHTQATVFDRDNPGTRIIMSLRLENC